MLGNMFIEWGKIHWPKLKDVFVTTKNILLIVLVFALIVLALQFLLSFVI